MQVLRHAPRQALRASAVVWEPSIASTRGCSTDAATRVVVRLSKEERHQRVSQFVEKFKATNNGQLPSLNLLRREVGGSYDILKEMLQGFENGSGDKVASEKTVDLQKSKTQKPAGTKQGLQGADGVTQKTTAAAKDGSKKKSSSKQKNVKHEGAATMQDQHDEEELTKALPMQDQHTQEALTKLKKEVTKRMAEIVRDGQKKQSLSKKEKESGQDKKSTPKILKTLKAMKSVKQADANLMTKRMAEIVRDGQKKQSLSKKEKESGQDKKSTPKILKTLKAMKSVKQADANLMSDPTKKQEEYSVQIEESEALTKMMSDDTTKQKQSSVVTEETLESLMDTLSTDEDNDDDDSDVAAPEYHQFLTTQVKEGPPQSRERNSKVDSVVNSKNDDQAFKSGLHMKDGKKIETMQKGLGAVQSVIRSMARQPSPDWSSGPGNRPPTTVLRIVNLPAHISAHQLRSVCESVARVHGVNLRRGRIADVHFDVELREMNNVLDRLRKVTIGNISLKVFPALRFSCESNMTSRFKPRDVHQFKHVRNGLINAFEQRFKFLCFQVQDFRELHNLKVAK